jgi:hypothetical protein
LLLQGCCLTPDLTASYGLNQLQARNETNDVMMSSGESEGEKKDRGKKKIVVHRGVLSVEAGAGEERG